MSLVLDALENSYRENNFRLLLDLEVEDVKWWSFDPHILRLVKYHHFFNNVVIQNHPSSTLLKRGIVAVGGLFSYPFYALIAVITRLFKSLFFDSTWGGWGSAKAFEVAQLIARTLSSPVETIENKEKANQLLSAIIITNEMEKDHLALIVAKQREAFSI